MYFDSKAAQVGTCSDVRTGAVSTPIYQTATFCHPALGQSTGYDYTRSHNPTRQILEEGIAALEEGYAGFAFSSGMAAITAVVMLYRAGDHLVVSEDCYGGTYRVLEKVFASFGLQITFVDGSDLAAVKQAIRAETKAIFVETPSNPLMNIADIEKLAELAKENDSMLIIDNTFLTPYFQRPLTLGADIVIHSASKYLAGHNDLIAGLVVARTPEIAERVRFVQNAAGAVLSPNDSWLLIRSLKTLALRMRRHEENAKLLAVWLTQQTWVEQVYYPGLDKHPGKEVQDRQSSGYGGMISFRVTSPELAAHILKKVRLLRFAESLGGVETLITLPAVQTHADVPPEVRERLGVTQNLLRLSVGIEDARDLIADLAQAAIGNAEQEAGRGKI
ncbi:PLP-dependent aspartate aminotransferase family protein [Azotosporobacter soli]|uniref:trans-sulfuration enzyme family protein n=1 Tax=Azotosporobacter soli TaxID=3055040 RepID=UPI0031FF37CD